MNANCTAAIAHAIHDRRTRRLLLVQFASDLLKGLILAAACRCGTHDLFDPNLRGSAVFSAVDSKEDYRVRLSLASKTDWLC